MYCFDTSVFINAWNRDYPLDVFPTVWDNINGMVADFRIVTPEEVRIELERKDDMVLEWANERAHVFVPIDASIQIVVADILRQFPRLIDTRRGRSGADPFVVALAQVRGLSVVTYEKPTGNLDRPNIPDVCMALDIERLSIMDVARREQWQV